MVKSDEESTMAPFNRNSFQFVSWG